MPYAQGASPLGRPLTHRLAATRRLAHLLLERRIGGAAGDREAAIRILDSRAAPTETARAKIIEEALHLVRAAAEWLEANPGVLRSDLRIALRDRGGRPFSVTVPSVLLRPDGAAAVLVMAPGGDRNAHARARRYRFAVRSLLQRPTGAFLVRPGGTVTRLASLAGDRDRG